MQGKQKYSHDNINSCMYLQAMCKFNIYGRVELKYDNASSFNNKAWFAPTQET